MKIAHGGLKTPLMVPPDLPHRDLLHSFTVHVLTARLEVVRAPSNLRVVTEV